MTASARTRIAAFILFLGIILGALGAHWLYARLAEAGRVDTWETAVLYHLIHGLALFVVAARPRALGFWPFLVGIIIFSGSLYLLSVTGFSKLGMITPIGGVAFLVGWARWIFAKRSDLPS